MQVGGGRKEFQKNLEMSTRQLLIICSGIMGAGPKRGAKRVRRTGLPLSARGRERRLLTCGRIEPVTFGTEENKTVFGKKRSPWK